jgi:hypothetical protein
MKGEIKRREIKMQNIWELAALTKLGENAYFSPQIFPLIIICSFQFWK